MAWRGEDFRLRRSLRTDRTMNRGVRFFQPSPSGVHTLNEEATMLVIEWCTRAATDAPSDLHSARILQHRYREPCSDITGITRRGC